MLTHKDGTLAKKTEDTMSKKYNFEYPDKNEAEIVKGLSEIPGMVVYPKYNDLIIGYEGCTIWGEVKNPDKLKKNGKFKKHAFTEKQKKINDEFTGCRVVGVTCNDFINGIAQHFSDIGFIRIAENLRRFKR